MRTIIHIDMDAFYASVEQRDHPEFKGKPVIVGANPQQGRGRGVVSAASYEARTFGIHSAQPITQAYRLCPHGIFLPVRGKRYAEVSKRIMKLFYDSCPCVEPISLDEAFLDMAGMKRVAGNIKKVGWRIKKLIWEQERLTASVGIGPNKLIAKMASDLEKPDGFVVVEPDEIPQFLSPLPVSKLWGVGPKTGEKLSNLGIKTIGELALYPRETLETFFGRWGNNLYGYAHGIDESPVVSDSETKSVSNETTFLRDVSDLSILEQTILQLSEKVGYRLRKQGLKGRTITLKLRLDDFTTFVRHITIQNRTNNSETIYREAISLFHLFDLSNRSVRLLGVGMAQLNSIDQTQGDLFEDEDIFRRKQMTDVLDELKNKFGEKIIQKGSMLPKNK